VNSANQTRTAQNLAAAGAWFDVRCRQEGHDVDAYLAQKAVVLLGETHDNAAHHRWQLDTFVGLHERRPNLILGFEMFPRRIQPVLDRWSKGELEDVAFLAEVDWPRVWGFDPELYMPLFRFARSNKLPVLALNVDRETNRQVAAAGFGSLPMQEREGVGEPAPASSRYQERLRAWFERHSGAGGSAGLNPPRLERFIRAQQFWDRAMAEAIAGALRHSIHSLVIGIMGSGHIEYGDGVPLQLNALGIRDVATALPWTAEAVLPSGEPPIADFVFGIKE